jgi:hypothetical protein
VEHERSAGVGQGVPAGADVHQRHPGLSEGPGGRCDQGLAVHQRERQRTTVGLDDGPERIDPPELWLGRVDDVVC